MKIRTQIPKNNKHYMVYSSGGYNGAIKGYPTIPTANVLCNCVGYSNGRFNEIINDPDLKGIAKPFKYQLVCNAENFIESAKKQGLKISSKPTVGGILVWQKGSTLGGGDGAGHVAICEQIYKDGSILTSESGYGSLDWKFKNLHRNNANGRWGQAAGYKFRGCIVNPAVKNGEPVDPPKLVVDGIGGTETVLRMQEYFKTPMDGMVTGQNKANAKLYPSLTAVSFGGAKSSLVVALQKWCGTSQDGIIGKGTTTAWQKKLAKEGYYSGKIDGIFGTLSMKAWQRFLNNNGKPTPVPPTPTKKYKVIDVSEWQGNIDWKKVKADGVVGAIIRYGDGDYKDIKFDTNMKNAKANGLHFGAYIFSRAKTIAEAQKEARLLFNSCKKYAPDMPLYIDLEDNSQKSIADKIAQAFLNEIKDMGGTGGVYANVTWWNNYLTNTASKNPIMWVAQYYKECQYKPLSRVGMWQYSSSGSVNGIKGNVDMDWCYHDYWNDKPTPTPTKKGYTGTYPDINRTKKLVEKAVELAWAKGTPAKKYAWKGGTSTEAFKKALDKVYPNRSSWGKAAKVGCSCDVFVGTCVRACGLDKSFPRGLEQQFKYSSKDCTKATYKNAKPIDKSKDGDIVLFDYAGNGAHIVIRGNGYYYEAGFETTYGHVNTSLARLKKTFPKVVVFRPKNCLAKGDSGLEVERLQKYLVWFGYNIGVDGVFGDTTLKYVKAMQKKMEKEGVYTGAIDGIVGAMTLKSMKAYKK